MKKYIVIAALCFSCIQAGRVEIQVFKNAVMGKNLQLAAGIFAALDSKDQKAAGDWYKNNKINDKDLPSIGGFDWSKEAPNADNAAKKLDYIGKNLVKPALDAVGTKEAKAKFVKDVQDAAK